MFYQAASGIFRDSRPPIDFWEILESTIVEAFFRLFWLLVKKAKNLRFLATIRLVFLVILAVWDQIFWGLFGPKRAGVKGKITDFAKIASRFSGGHSGLFVLFVFPQNFA